MTATLKELVPVQHLGTGTASLFTATEETVITAITVVNTSASSDATFDAHVTTDLDPASASNQVVNGHRVRPGESYQVPELRGQVLSPTQSLHMGADAAAVLTVRISGVEIS